MLKRLLLLPLLAATAFAQTEHQLVITEKSSTSLTATFDGSSMLVSLLNPDRWRITSAAPGIGYSVFATPEPENASLVNIIVFGHDATGLPFISVLSDYQLGVTGTVVPIITAEQNGVGFQDGTDANGNPIIVTFNDDAAASEASVPDATSTAGLLMLSVFALGGVSRLALAKS